MSPQTNKLIFFLTALVFFIVAFVLNITSNTSLYNQDLNIVPQWQTNAILGSNGFMDFMNVVSMLLDPPICAAYLAIFWLISSRKLEIMVFLIWFIFLSWLLSVFKSAIHQPRPFWKPDSGIEMRSWVCYTDFGCPSGHSMMGLILLEFVVRFYSRWYAPIRKNIGFFYILIVLIQCLLMFSRVILGMHSFNQVLMGLTISIFSIALYYSYVQSMLIRMVAKMISRNSLESQSSSNNQKNRMKALTLLGLSIAVAVAIDLIVFLVPDYQNDESLSVLEGTSGCEDIKVYKSFQYKSLQDLAIIMAAFGIIFSLLYLPNPSILVRPLSYTRLSLKFIARIVVQVICAAIPLAIFLNPGWSMIDVDTAWLAVIIWVCQSLGFFFAIIMLILVSSILLKKWQLQTHGDVEYCLIVQADGTIQCQMGESPKRKNDKGLL